MTYQIQSSFDENFKIISTLNPSAQNLTTEYVDVPPSHIDYKPSSTSTYVLFQFTVFFNRRDTSSATESNCFFKLQYSDDNGATWSDWGDNTECYVGSAGTFLRQKSTVDVKWVLNTTGWTSTKRLRVLSKEDSGSDNTLHELEEFYDSGGIVSGTNNYGCSVSCYSLE